MKRYFSVRMLSGLLATLALVLIVTHCGPVKKKVECYPCITGYDQQNNPIWGTCWGAIINWDGPPAMTEMALDVDYEESQHVFSLPGGAELEVFGGDALIDYIANHQRLTFSSPMAYDATASAALTASQNDGKDWHVLSMSGSESEYNTWLAGTGSQDVLHESTMVIAADWGPATPGCEAFDTYSVGVYQQSNATDGRELIENVTTSWGETLAARLIGPISVAPSSSFTTANPEQTRASFVSTIEGAVEDAIDGEFTDAITALSTSVIGRIDGVIGGDPSNDVIDDPDLQEALIAAANTFIDELESAQSACNP